MIADIPLIGLVAEEPRRAFHFKEKSSRTQLREGTLKIWQQWNILNSVAVSTKTLIPNLYYGFLSDRGHFQSYLKRFSLAESNACLHWGVVHMHDHAIRAYGRWGKERSRLESRIGKNLD